ncbi:Catechol 1,2-dioxygenase [Crocosphaera watsonii WH 0402]|uniref:Catechol 1,2-dioxygenase n=1 Tax=Crocosphaera watsonii WH 0402 TaxID=1284629 RepID=T2JME4_CROWT|nr:Catechol 1,2-dioxygenase [Crocosphaera watsonii WH 0402]
MFNVQCLVKQIITILPLLYQLTTDLFKAITFPFKGKQAGEVWLKFLTIFNSLAFK